VTRSFVRLAPRFAAMSSIFREQEREGERERERERERNILKENPGRGTVSRSVLSKSRRWVKLISELCDHVNATAGKSMRRL